MILSETSRLGVSLARFGDAQIAVQMLNEAETAVGAREGGLVDCHSDTPAVDVRPVGLVIDGDEGKLALGAVRQFVAESAGRFAHLFGDVTAEIAVVYLGDGCVQVLEIR